MPRARRVAAHGRQRTVRHAIWVEGDTKPYDPVLRLAEGETLKERLQRQLDSGQIREGQSECGVWLPVVIAGEQGGHDWDRTPNEEKCINCRRALGELE